VTTSTHERIIEAAAEARAAGVRAPADRPSQRRCAEEPGSRPAALVRAQRMEVRASGDEGDDRLHFTGFASVYERFYEMWDMFGPYEEQVISGAGEKSLAREDLDVPLVLQHESLRRIARTTNGSLTVDERIEDEVEGLYVDAPYLDPRDADVAYIAPKLMADGDRAPLIDEMSFRFRIIRGQWSEDWATYSIEEYDIHRGDVAIVAYGANPHTQGAGLRGAQMPAVDDLTDAQRAKLENDLHAYRRRQSGQAPMTRSVLAAVDELING
jgi:HK97 family phage prohead protease